MLGTFDLSISTGPFLLSFGDLTYYRLVAGADKMFASKLVSGLILFCWSKKLSDSSAVSLCNSKYGFWTPGVLFWSHFHIMVEGMLDSLLKQQLSSEEDSPWRFVFKTKKRTPPVTPPPNLVFMVCMYLTWDKRSGQTHEQLELFLSENAHLLVCMVVHRHQALLCSHFQHVNQESLQCYLMEVHFEVLTSFPCPQCCSQQLVKNALISYY